MPQGGFRDHYGDGAWYDAEYVHIGGDVAYYASVAADAGGPVLELACGTGRLTIPMAQAGVTVTGVDYASAMLAQAEEKKAKLPAADRARLDFVLGDMRAARLGREYRAVILGFNTLMHMTVDEDLAAVLETARTHLDPGGLFHLDLYTPYPELLSRDPDGRFDPQEMIDPHTGARYVVSESTRYDPRTQINTMTFYYQQVDKQGRAMGVETRTVLELRVIFPRELDRWLHLAGFEIVGEWDDFERTRVFSGRGGRRILAARRR